MRKIVKASCITDTILDVLVKWLASSCFKTIKVQIAICHGIDIILPPPPTPNLADYDLHKATSSLQCYSVISDILVKNELCIPLERGSNVLSTGKGFICLSPPSKLKIAVLFCSIYKKTISSSAIVF